MNLLRAGIGELRWGLRATSREIDRWRMRAQTIPVAERRADALEALSRKRGNVHGAAMFWTLAGERNAALLRTLVGWEVLADYLDCVSERDAHLGTEHGHTLHRALVEALRPGKPASHHYGLDGARDDGGYTRAIVSSCRAGCAQLPRYAELAPLASRAAELTSVLSINHIPDPARRDRALAEWAARELPSAQHAWFERTAGASAWLTVLAMLSLAARRPAHRRDLGRIRAEAERAYTVYLDWIAPVGAMLDSYGDLAEDAASKHHSYVGHYASREQAVQRIGDLIRRSRTAVDALPDRGRHRTVLGCMIAFYLSKDSVHSREMRAGTRSLLRAGGPMAIALLPALRAWRCAYGQQAA